MDLQCNPNKANFPLAIGLLVLFLGVIIGFFTWYRLRRPAQKTDQTDPPKINPDYQPENENNSGSCYTQNYNLSRTSPLAELSVTGPCHVASPMRRQQSFKMINDTLKRMHNVKKLNDTGKRELLV
mgnify:CR=1 FL=1